MKLTCVGAVCSCGIVIGLLLIAVGILGNKLYETEKTLKTTETTLNNVALKFIWHDSPDEGTIEELKADWGE